MSRTVSQFMSRTVSQLELPNGCKYLGYCMRYYEYVWKADSLLKDFSCARNRHTVNCETYTRLEKGEPPIEKGEPPVDKGIPRIDRP